MSNPDELKASASNTTELYALVNEAGDGVDLCVVQVWDVGGNRVEKELARVAMSFRAFHEYANLLSRFKDRVLERYAMGATE